MWKRLVAACVKVKFNYLLVKSERCDTVRANASTVRNRTHAIISYNRLRVRKDR